MLTHDANIYELIGLVWLATKPNTDYLITCPNDCGVAIVGRHECGCAFSECVCGACDLCECFDPNCAHNQSKIDG